MLKKQSKGKVSLGMRCGDCLHFKDGAKKFEKHCAELEVDERSWAPDCYSPNIYAIRDVKNPDMITQLGKLIKDFSPKQIRIISFVLSRQGGILAKQGLQFGQPVYFSLGGEFVSHFFRGYVVSASDDYVYVTSQLKKCKSNTSLTLLRKSVYTFKEYKVLEAKLVAKNKIYMEDRDKKLCRALPIAELLDKNGMVPHVEQFVDGYEPPTLDTAPESWFNIYEASIQNKLKKKKKQDSTRINMTEAKSPLEVKIYDVDRNKKLPSDKAKPKKTQKTW